MIPRTLKIKGSTWRVKIKRNLKNDDGESCYGLCDYDKRLIFLEAGMNDREKMTTLIHEIFHGTLHEIHIHLNHDLDETICDALSSITTDLFHIRLKRKCD